MFQSFLSSKVLGMVGSQLIYIYGNITYICDWMESRRVSLVCATYGTVGSEELTRDLCHWNLASNNTCCDSRVTVDYS